MRRIKILSVMLNIVDGSGPFRRIRNINNDKFDLKIVTYFDRDTQLARYKNQTNHEIVGFNAKSYLDLNAFIKVKNYVLKEKPDIIHSFHNFTAILGVWVKKYNKNIKFIHSFGTSFKKIKLPFRIIHQVLTFKYADKIVCSSHSVKRSLGRLSKIYRDKIVVINNGINAGEIIEFKRFRHLMRSSFNISDDIVIIGSVGRLIPLKNHVTIIEALNLLQLQKNNFKFFLIGDGKERKRLFNMVKKYRLEDKVILTGQVSQTDVYKYLSMMDIYIQLSLWEGMSAAAQEAMAMGLPVVLSDIPSHRELLKNGGGFLVPPNRINEIYRTLIMLIENSDLRFKVGSKAQNVVRENYSLSKTKGRYEKLYYEVMRN